MTKLPLKNHQQAVAEHSWYERLVADFPCGKVINIQTVGEYHVVKYHPTGHPDRSRNSWLRSEAVVYYDEICYQVYRSTGYTPFPVFDDEVFRPVEVFDTLDAALVNAIAVKHDGINTRVDEYFMKSIH